MPLGVDRPRREIAMGDSAELESYVYRGDDIPIDPDDVVSITYSIEKPDGVTETDTGTVQGNGSGLLIFYDTDQTGRYTVTARHEFTDGRIRTDRFYFTVIDPFNPPPVTRNEEIVNAAWRGLEDLFDSEQGGPWLQDMSLAGFGRAKADQFIGEAILLVNDYPPTTHLTILDFTQWLPDPGDPAEMIADPDQSILYMALRLVLIRHLIRSYVEQPDPRGAQVVHESRRDYMERWITVLQMEEDHFFKQLALWKRQFYGFYDNKLLLGSKAGRLGAAGVRQRNAIRGGWY